jgi:excisionase family DNA binding protein
MPLPILGPVQVVREPVLLTAREAGRLLGVSPKTVIRLAQSGDLRAVRLGERGRWRILRAGIDEIVRGEQTVDQYGSVRPPLSRREETG